jgi:glycyl-tRNA synthetase alpha chain
MEVTQFTYFQQMGGFDCKPVAGELTYGLERLAMYLPEQGQRVRPRLSSGRGVTYGDVFLENEQQMSKWNFEVPTPRRCSTCSARPPPNARTASPRPADPRLRAGDRASHVFNLLQARGVISVQERASYMGRVRDLARGSCEAYMAKEADRWAAEYRGGRRECHDTRAIPGTGRGTARSVVVGAPVRCRRPADLHRSKAAP